MQFIGLGHVTILLFWGLFPLFLKFSICHFSDRNQVHVVCTMTMNIIFYFIFKLDWMFIELVLLPMILLPSLIPPPPPCNGMGGGGGGYTSIMSLSSSLRLSQILFYPISWKIIVRFYKYFTGRCNAMWLQ